MRNSVAKWLSRLMIVALLLSPTALAEESISPEVEQVKSEGIPVMEDSSATSHIEAVLTVTPVEAEWVDEAVDETEENLGEMEEDVDEVEANIGEDEGFFEAVPLFSGEDCIEINETNFPDYAFRYYLANYIDDNPKDGLLSLEERSRLGVLNDQTFGDLYKYLSEEQKKALKEELHEDDYGFFIKGIGGYQYFPDLSLLDASIDHNLTALDVSQNNHLNELYVGSNVETLILGNQPYLTTCWAIGAKLSELDVSGCTKLLPYLKEEYRKSVTDSDGYEYWRYWYSDGDFFDISFKVGKNVKLITQKSTPPETTVPAAADPTPEVVSTPATVTTVTAVKKNSKATISAVPGTVCSLDLGGATGKAFKSSKKKVATVNSQGQVTIKGAGKTKITFKVGKKKRTVTLTVKDPTIPTSVTLTAPTTAVKKGDVVTLTPAIPENTSSTFKWKSSNKKVATVKNGVVTFKKPGKVTITCTAVRGKKKARLKFTVSK